MTALSKCVATPLLISASHSLLAMLKVVTCRTALLQRLRPPRTKLKWLRQLREFNKRSLKSILSPEPHPWA
jgi:hypothetical protein